MMQYPVLYKAYFDEDSADRNDLEEALSVLNLHHYASLLLRMGFGDEVYLQQALQKAITACKAANLPANRHFKLVFICSGNNIREDWLVSDLGLQLILLNADVSNPKAARWQIQILSQQAN